MKLSPDRPHSLRLRLIPLATASVCAIALAGWQARAALPRWMQDVVSASTIEAALYRAMELPGVKALYPRPPKEAQGELSNLIGKSSNQAELYSLRAMEEDQALDFKAAEVDWKAYAAKASDQLTAKVDLANYYHRRMQAMDEVQVLMQVGSSGAFAAEMYVAPTEQQSWKAFERILLLAADQDLADTVTANTYAAWIVRYPDQASLYAREFQWLLEKKNYAVAKELLGRYQKAFPKDSVFPVKAAALLAYRQGSMDEAIHVYDASFAPLWPAELVESYYALLTQAHQQRRFQAEARAHLAQNADDLNAMARLFYAAQQEGNLASAQQIVDAYRLSKESRKVAWSAEELHTLAQLTEGIHAYPEAARYYFALYHAEGPRQAEGLSGIIRILLTAPDQPTEIGAGNLSMYRDIATFDQGPGYWNGILSLWLNTTNPAQAYQLEEQRMQPYFHRAKAAELLALLDKSFPQAASRSELHKQMIQVFSGFGESALVLKAGNEFLNSFPALPDVDESEADRVLVAMLMADAYARQQDTKNEFALYDRLLAELSKPTAGMPLTAAAASNRGVPTSSKDTNETTPGSAETKARAFELNPGKPVAMHLAAAQAYQTLLERYLGRLTATGQLPQALALLRRELDHNPNDPLLYERLASFLEQNNLSAQQEAVYQQAIQKFQEKGWYDKLARLYLREKKREAFADLTRKVTDIFHGTELEEYFQQVTQGGPQLSLQLNLYAHQRFPHDQVFVRNLLQAYQSKATRDQAAWEKLMREHWADSAELRAEFFDYLSRSGKLEAELSRLHELVPDAPQQKANPAAARELAEAEMWRSHFEQSAPLLGSLSEAYPADEEIGTQASSIFRSLAYYDAAQTERAVAVEKHLLDYDPNNAERLARIGDVYADSGADIAGHENLSAAAPYWHRMAALHPGNSDGYLQAATVFWDYFQFDEALGQIHEARTKFAQPHLYGYEAGAIEEGKRNMPEAIREYAAAAADGAGANSAAAARLLQLARRSATAKMVDEATAHLADTRSVEAIQLRLRVLKVQKREAEIGGVLDAALNKATTFEQAEAIATQAQAYALTALYEKALTREIALVHDPVQKIELTYNLAQSLEGRKHIDEAARVIDDVYDANPKLLGVVRATADFYWRNKQSAKSINTLVAAAKDANPMQPALAHQFLVEAAGKANDAGSYEEARNLIAPLLEANAEPYNPQYLAAVAESYAGAGDDAGLKQFYLAKLDSIKSAKLNPEDRKQNTVLLRRGLIPALTRLKDYAGAMEQYIAILSSYPEDTGAIQEASLYALRYTKQAQLVAFVDTTVKASPRDSRFAIMLGQVQTTFENYPAAIDAYAHAISIRADRSDVYAAKADLEERLQRFDDACKDYERLYKLSYQNPDWMLKVATVRARQGRNADAVKALERAWIEGHPPVATNDFRVAAQLESWKMLDEAMRYVELGMKAEGDDFLGGSAPGNQNGDDPQGAVLYARLMTRTRQPEKALGLLDAARKAAEVSPNSPGIVLQQVEKQGLASVTDSEWRKQRIEQRTQTATQRYNSALLEIATAVATYFTPEEKVQFARLLDARWTLAEHSGWSDRSQWIRVAHTAGLLDAEARFRKQVLLDRVYEKGTPSDEQYNAYIQLQRSRLEYVDLAQTLEAYALLREPKERVAPRIAAVEAWRSAGDQAAEMRALRRISFAGNRNAYLRERYLQLLLKHGPAGLEAFAAGTKDESAALAVANYAAAHSNAKTALATLNAHAPSLDAVWKSAYTALLGLYFHDTSSTISASTEAAFHSALGDEASIGQRVDAHAKLDRSQQLAGGTWFYYAMRYGVYRTLAPEKDWAQRDPEDFLAAGLEHNPASISNYITLAHAYADAGKTTSALVEYDHALELAPDSPAIHDAMAMLLWESDTQAAIAHWRTALTALNRIQDKGPAPESFWSSFALISQHLGRRKLTTQFHPELDALLRNYITRNGNYRSEELLQAAFLASSTPDEGVQWVLSLSTAAIEPAEILNSIATAAWLPKQSREPILLRQLELARIAAARSTDEPHSYSADRLSQIQKSLATYYMDQKQENKADGLLQQMSEAQRNDPEMVELRIQLAAHNHTLSKLLTQWREDADMGKGVPDAQRLRHVAATLNAEGNAVDALALWEFVFARGEADHALQASDYLGLAAARMETKDVAGAVEVLHRMTMLPGDPYANYELAAGLLERKSRPAEAVAFLSVLTRAVPWESSYKLRLARAQMLTGKDTHEAVVALHAVAASRDVSYSLRTQAALALKGQDAPSQASLGSAELQLLAAGKASQQQAAQPYFVAARILAAQGVTDAAQRALVLRQAIAIQPTESADAVDSDNLPYLLFRTEADAGHGATALALLEAMQSGVYRQQAASQDDGDSTMQEGDAGAEGGVVEAEAADATDEMPTRMEGEGSLAELERLAPLPGPTLAQSEKLALALQIARVYEQTDAAASAVPYLRLAARIETNAKQKAEMQMRIDQINTTILLETRNAQRRPIIQKALDQSTLVRPRLSAADLAHEVAQ